MESPRRYILDKIVGGFIYVLFVSYLCPIYVLKDMVDRLRVKCYAVRYLELTSTSNWARYVDRIRSQVRTGVDQYRLFRVLPNRLTSIYSKNHYEEENYLKVKTVVFKYLTPPYSNSSVC